MASEHRYPPGQRLEALICAVQMGVTFKTALNYNEPQDAHPWDDRVSDMQRQVVEDRWERRQAARKQLRAGGNDGN